MDVREALHRSRSYRRFYQDVRIPDKDMMIIADAARLSPSGRNIQALKFLLSNTEEVNRRIYPHLAWAGYLTDWEGPKEGERPAAYIIQLLDSSITSDPSCDAGITAQTILLQSVELGYGGCIIASVKRETLAKILSIPEQFSIIQVIALGKPIEEIRIEPMQNGEYKYWRDGKSVHHVPKRGLDEIILKNFD